MKPEHYAHALARLIAGGDTPHKAVQKTHELLKTQKREHMLPQIARSFARIMQVEYLKNRSVLAIARVKDESRARKESGAKDAELVLDETLIGGWRLEAQGVLQDASWKHHLLNIYKNTTRT